MSLSCHDEPQNYEAAIQNPLWVQAMQNELAALAANQTWSNTDLPPGKSTISCRWVYKIKYHSNGTIERYKAKLVAKGYNQMDGLDFLDTFAPVAKLTTLRLLLALATTKNWDLKQLDVNNTFLHGDLNEEVYMKLPSGFPAANRNKVCKLQRYIYGLKQVGRQWYAKLSNFLKSHNYNIFTIGHSLFLKHDGEKITALLVCVDAIVLTGNNLASSTLRI